MIVDKLGLDASSHVVEVASNDGYLLQYFLEKGIPALGIEPATNVAETAIDAGIPTINDFFGVDTASQLTEEQRADLLIGNNVLAHVPDINDFVEGLRIALKPSGIITMEFPHLLHLLERREFDTIYHEHFSYFSLQTVAQIFEHHGVPVFDVEEIPTHGGSIRIYARHKENATCSPTARLQKLLEREVKSGITELATYTSFADEVKEVKRDVLDFLINAKRNGSSIVGYGAAAKGNTLFNYCGIGTDFIDYVVDRNPHKQGQYLPGTQIPVFAPQKIFETKPEYVIIVPWNLKDEIMKQMSAIQSWGGRFVTFIPGVEIHD
jgi:2-polyprenyl-3-methyl-5-hydroxy-6-metoxy-1,4-benzoquinol methylase